MKLAFENDTTISEVKPVDCSEEQLEAQAAINHMFDLKGETEEAMNSVTELAQGAGTVDQFQQAMQASVDSGTGLNETSAEIAEIALEAIFSKFDLKGKKPIVALEAYGSKNSRLAATKISLETLKETAQKLWDAFIKAMKFLWDKIRAFYQHLNPKKKTLKEYYESVKKEMVAAKSFTWFRIGDIPGHFAPSLNIGGKCDFRTADGILTNSMYMLSGMSELSAANLDTAKKAHKIFSNVTDKSTDADIFSAKQDFGSVFRDYVTRVGNIHGFKILQAGDGANAFAGGYIFNLGNKDSIDFTFKHSGIPDEIKEVKALTYSQMEALILKVETMFKDFDKYDKCYLETEKLFEELNKMNSVGSDVGGIFYAAMRRIMEVAATMNTKAVAILLTAMKASCDYVHASSKAYLKHNNF